MSGELGTEDNPYPVRSVATRVQAWIDRLGAVWIEGQLTEITVRGSITFMVLRDPSADMSLRANCSSDLVRAAPVKLTEGVQVLVLAKPQFDPRRGSFAMRVRQIRAVGLGELLARIEMLRKVLDAEGLFDPRLKRPLPFLPNMVGLITGRASAAEHDVTSVAADRCPAVRFRIRNTAVQGTGAVAQIVEALAALDADPEVDVIVIARGGGSVEDLLPFSDETLCRAIATSPTTRCAIWWPTSAPPPPPTPPSGSCPTPRPNCEWCVSCGSAAHARCATGSRARDMNSDSCAAARCWPTRCGW